MKIPTSSESVGFLEVTVLLQALILGFLFGEVWFLAQIIGASLHLHNPISFTSVLSPVFFAIATIITFLFYIYKRDWYSSVRKFLKISKIDLLSLVVLFSLGLSGSVFIEGLGSHKYKEYVDKIPIQLLWILVTTPLVIALMFLLRTCLVSHKKDQSAPIFINDNPIESTDQDALGLSDYAFRFAESVLNGGSTDSLVFGIDAPWGAGKSSFVNFCCEYWRDHTNSQTIVHRFEPLRYKDSTDLVEMFVTELVSAIQDHVFIPSIHSLFAKYLRQLNGKNQISIFGMKFDFESNSHSVELTLKTLETRLLDIDRKIIIVIDDLDRLSWSEVKSILFAVKRSFMLPNISYVLCYDTENLESLRRESGDAENVREFLEKFVNLKIGLYADSRMLAKFVSEDIDKAINKNLQLNVHLLDQIKQTLEAVVDTYKSNEYHNYQAVLGDVRKVKRLINTMMLFGIPATDFKNSDFHKKDLMHLMLVYINYPNVFRKIYYTETEEKNGFFSLARNNSLDAGESRFINSVEYGGYIDTLDPTPRFLLNQIFDKQISANPESEDRELQMNTRACFNGVGGTKRNLERYLNLIVKITKQDKREAYQFYVNKLHDLLSGISIAEIFEAEEFSFSDGDFTRDQLWSVIANSAQKMEPRLVSEVLVYLMENITNYSFLGHEKVGAESRVNLVYSLLKLLDDGAWGKSSAERRNNSEKNISEISEWVFGEGRHTDSGVITTLGKAERGPMGLFDLLLFRLYCSADRGSSLFNIQRAISLHSNPNAPTQGLTTEIAKEGMREISQIVFQIFSVQYIKTKKNIFQVIDDLSLDDVAGKTAEFVRNQIKLGKVSNDVVEDIVARERSHIKSFVIYQLGNSFISSGVGCGYYDEIGVEDKKGISERVNKYLFGVCFNPKISVENYQRFLDYLLLNFSRNYGIGINVEYTPNINELTKVLIPELLKKYWIQHRRKIRSLELEKKSKRVVTHGYIATYDHDLPSLYRVLDDFAQS